MADVLRKLYLTGAHSDFEVVCGPKTFAAHKAIVCAQSLLFSKACEKDTWKEGQEHVVALESKGKNDKDPSKDDPEIVQCMFDFLYLQSYGSGRSGTTDSEVNRDSFILHAKVYAMGEKYGIPSLKEAATERFREDTHFICADDDFTEAVELAFTTTPDSDRGLRNLIIQVLHNNASRMKDNVEIKKLIVTHNDLACGLWEVTSTLPSGPKCPVCHVAFVRECKSSGKGFVSCDCDGRKGMRKACSECRDRSLIIQSMMES